MVLEDERVHSLAVDRLAHYAEGAWTRCYLAYAALDQPDRADQTAWIGLADDGTIAGHEPLHFIGMRGERNIVERCGRHDPDFGFAEHRDEGAKQESPGWWPGTADLRKYVRDAPKLDAYRANCNIRQ